MTKVWKLKLEAPSFPETCYQHLVSHIIQESIVDVNLHIVLASGPILGNMSYNPLWVVKKAMQYSTSYLFELAFHFCSLCLFLSLHCRPHSKMIIRTVGTVPSIRGKTSRSP